MTPRLELAGAGVVVRPAWWLAPVRLLDPITFDLAAGEVAAVIGPSGSGKSTLARLAAGLVSPHEGAVRVDGIPPAQHRGVQWLSQDSRALLNPALPIGAQVAESQRVHGTDGDPLAAVGLAHRADALPRALSGGERRRAALARVLAARPALLIADEPTSGLDQPLRAEILDLLLALRPAGCSLLLVTHDLHLLPGRCDRVLRLTGGVLAAEGPVDAATLVALVADTADRTHRKQRAANGVDGTLASGGGDGAS